MAFLSRRFAWRRRMYLLLALLVFSSILIADQLSKTMVLDAKLMGRIPMVINEWFNLLLVWNRGVSFGMLAQDAAWGPWALKGLAAILMLVMLRWLWNANHWAQAVALGAILGGAVGNVIDRFRYGAVVDFLDFHYGDWHYPAFNIADAGICIGVVILVLESIVTPLRRPKVVPQDTSYISLKSHSSQE